MNGPKWLPRDLQTSFYLFDDVGSASSEIKCLANRFLNEINLKIPDNYVSLNKSKKAMKVMNLDE